MIASLQMGCLKTAKDSKRHMVMARDPNLKTVLMLLYPSKTGPLEQ
jgi:hypothetical protein